MDRKEAVWDTAEESPQAAEAITRPSKATIDQGVELLVHFGANRCLVCAGALRRRSDKYRRTPESDPRTYRVRYCSGCWHHKVEELHLRTMRRVCDELAGALLPGDLSQGQKRAGTKPPS